MLSEGIEGSQWHGIGESITSWYYFLYALKKSEKLRFSHVFRGYKKRTPGSNGLTLTGTSDQY